MTQQFKFGDRVYFPSNVEEIGIVIQVLNSENKIVVAWNDGEQTTEAIDDVQLTIIPHSDTVRLDFIQNNLMEIKLIENEDGQLFCIDKDGIWWEETFSETVRQSIDTMIREYEA